MNGRYNQSYMPLGDLKLDFPISGRISNYRRELDLANGAARVQYTLDGANFTREVQLRRQKSQRAL